MFRNWIKNVMYDPKIPILTDLDVKVIFQTQLGDRLHKNAIVILSDGHYTAIDGKDVNRIYKKANLEGFKYRDEVMDCDDAALAFKYALVNDAGNNWYVKYPYAAGIVYGHIPTPHAINWFITPEKRLMFIEPQTGEMFLPKGNNIFFLYS